MVGKTLEVKGNLNADLHKAAKNKNDEFYTQLTDIEKELRHYVGHFRGKVVYCNCDDPKISNFFQYFWKKFRHLGLKKLITTCYRNRSPDMFSLHDNESSVGMVIAENGNSGELQRDRAELPDIEIFNLDGDGDFRSEECISLLEQADIVVSNPPFSLFREYIAQLVEHGKRFLIIGNMNAVSYKEVFPMVKDQKVWLGPSISSGDREFGVPDHYPLTAATHRTDENGRKFIRVKGIRWFTNLDHKKRHEELILYRRFTPEDYPKYDNYDAINVDRTSEIPMDYAGAMGVPITFLDKYDPGQFEILDCNDIRLSDGVPVKGHGLIKDKDSAINGKPKYVRIAIRNRKPQS